MLHYFNPKSMAPSNKRPTSSAITEVAPSVDVISTKKRKSEKPCPDSGSKKARSNDAKKDEDPKGESNCKRKSGITQFFAKISKEEYRKSCGEESAKITVKALVHNQPSSLEEAAALTDVEDKCRSKKKFTNVSRPTKETDEIQVLQEDVVGEPEKGEENKKEAEKPSIVEESSIGDIEFFQQHCLKSRDLGSSNEASPICSPYKSRPEMIISTPVPEPTGKISTKLFKGPRKKTKVQKVEERDESGLFKRKEKSKKQKKSDKTTLNGYDSDSVDLDMLASYNRKTFCADVVSPTGDSSTDESPFAVLIRKPLISDKKRLEISPNENKENDVVNEDVSSEKLLLEEDGKSVGNCAMQTTNPKDAFSKLMSKQIHSCEEDNRNKSSVGKKKRGRPRKKEKVSVANQNETEVTKEITILSDVQDREQLLDDSLECFDVPASKKRRGKRKNLNNRLGRGKSSNEEKKQSSDCNVSTNIDDEAKVCDNNSGQGEGRRKSSRIKVRRERRAAEEAEAAKRLHELQCVVESRKEKSENDDDEVVIEKVVSPKKSKKLAPIFGKKGLKKLPLDPERAAARKAFLLSTAPETLRRQVSDKVQDTIPDFYVDYSKHIHVRQKDDDQFWNLLCPDLNLKPEHLDIKVSCYEGFQLSQTKTADKDGDVVEVQRLGPEEILKAVFQIGGGEKFDLFKSYCERKIVSDAIEVEAKRNNLSLNEIEEQRSLRSGRRRKKDLEKVVEQEFDTSRESSMPWTMKYMPRSSDDVIGNQETVVNLRSWLVDWDNNTCTDESDEEFSDEDSSSQNTALLIGPSGIGKTCTVYSLAQEMGFKVIEVNSSSCRNGKALLSNLREATQSHNVRKKGENAKKTAKKSLILLEEVDVVFDDLDDGFVSAVCTLISTTKRPIVLTTSCDNYLTLQRMKGISKFISQTFRFSRLNQDVIANHLQLLCLTEGFFVSIESLKEFSKEHGNCISSALHNLEFSIMSLPRKESSAKPLNADHFSKLIRDARNGVSAEEDLKSFDVPSLLHRQDETEEDKTPPVPFKDDLDSRREVREGFEVGIATSACKFSEDTLPYLREIARIEERRKNDQKKRSRSRFLHFFETMEVFMSSASIKRLTEAFS